MRISKFSSTFEGIYVPDYARTAVDVVSKDMVTSLLGGEPAYCLRQMMLGTINSCVVLSVLANFTLGMWITLPRFL